MKSKPLNGVKNTYFHKYNQEMLKFNISLFWEYFLLECYIFSFTETSFNHKSK